MHANGGLPLCSETDPDCQAAQTWQQAVRWANFPYDRQVVRMTAVVWECVASLAPCVAAAGAAAAAADYDDDEAGAFAG